MSDRPTYSRGGTRPATASQQTWKSHPESYDPSDELVHAVNVALTLRRPLLVTGEPGTGKTELATSVAWQLGLDEPERFDTRSASDYQSLFYTFDALGRFHEAQSTPDANRSKIEPTKFLKLQALGWAIVRTHDPNDSSIADLPPPHEKARHDRATSSVVLIDEIDKAPRDFPNDLLGAIERMEFRIAEMGQRRVAAAQTDAPAADRTRPIVIVTSNSERALPDAFLRRCAYHDVKFPDEKRLRPIVETRVAEAIADLGLPKIAKPAETLAPLVTPAIAMFTALRDADMRKKPATAELTDWITALYVRKGGAAGAWSKDAVIATLAAVVKRKDDLGTGGAVVEAMFPGGGRGA